MAKLLNGVEYNNALFAAAFGDYLIINGFTCTVTKEVLTFIKSPVQISVRHDQLDVYGFVPEAEDECEKWVFEKSFTGISHLNVFSWIRLMDIMEVSSIKDFKANAEKINAQWGQQASSILKFIYNSEKLVA